MSKEKWNEHRTRSFILAYLNKPSLWDSSCSDYTQKIEKERAYGELQNEFGMTVAETKNKIRIFRTTYNQEKKKEDTIQNYKPKLSWYREMKDAFEGGKAKTFSKTPTRIKQDKMKPEVIQYEIEQENDDGNNQDENQTEHQIIIEPYEEYEEEDDEGMQEITITKTKEEITPSRVSHTTHQQKQPSPTVPPLLSSNELFLQSLKSTLDKLPEEKNMRARISIQEVLYKIMYEK